jgi:hypothetical protein
MLDADALLCHAVIDSSTVVVVLLATTCTQDDENVQHMLTRMALEFVSWEECEDKADMYGVTAANSEPLFF